MGVALARGAQRHVMACVKHYACNSMENARFSVDVQVDERALHEVYLPHFRAVVDAGVASVMSAYNSVNGEWCGQNRDPADRDPAGRVGLRGLRHVRLHLGPARPGRLGGRPGWTSRCRSPSSGRGLCPPRSPRAGVWDDVDRPAARILRTQLRFAASVPEHAAADPDVVASAEHRALAREVAARSMVLLRNEPVDERPRSAAGRAGLARLAVVGRLADLPNTGDHGSSDVRRPCGGHTAGRAAGRAARRSRSRLRRRRPGPASAAAAADAAVVVVGYTAEDEGEYVGSFDPELAALYPPSDDPKALAELARVWEDGPQSSGATATRCGSPADEALIRAVGRGESAHGRRRRGRSGGDDGGNGGTTCRRSCMAWYSGMEGGAALADVLLGTSEPGGRLPFAVPRDEADLPPFDKNATTVTYDRWHGQRLLDRDGKAAAYPLGFGLSYTSFTVDDVEVPLDSEPRSWTSGRPWRTPAPGRAATSSRYTRTGRRGAGGHRTIPGRVRPGRLRPGRAVPVKLDVPLQRLATRQGPGRWAVPPGSYRIDVGASAADPLAVSVMVELS